jgi:hypothetical protein
VTTQLDAVRWKRLLAVCGDTIARAHFTRAMCGAGGISIAKLRRLTHEAEEAVEQLGTPWRIW